MTKYIKFVSGLVENATIPRARGENSTSLDTGPDQICEVETPQAKGLTLWSEICASEDEVVTQNVTTGKSEPWRKDITSHGIRMVINFEIGLGGWEDEL